MKIFMVLVSFYVAVLAMSMPGLVRSSRQGWGYGASVAALVLLSIAPVFAACFVINSAPYFNLYIPVAVLAGLLYAASFLLSLISIFLYFNRARGSVHRPKK